VQVALLWWLVPWRPRLRDASLKVLRELLRYGRFVSAGIILGIVNDSVDKVIVGRLLGTKPLGIYSVTYRLADLPTSVIGYVVGRVMLPAYASVQGDRTLFRRAFVQNLQRVALLSLPVGVGLAVGAEPLVRGLLGERWLPVVTPLRILAGYSIVRSFASCAGPPFQALGKPHLVPLFALPQTLITIPALLLLTPNMGVNGAALAMLIGFSCSGIPAFAYALHLIGLSSLDVLRALGASLLSSALLAAALAGLLWASVPLPAFGNLVLLAIAGLLVYGVATAVFARSTIAPIWASLRGTRSVTP
jgi:PST family polysaccharide transporter/lipopolysaccharide exporter